MKKYFLALLAVFIFAGCNSTTATLTIISTSPVANETEVPTDTVITVTFNNLLDTTTVNGANVVVSDGNTTISGTLSTDGTSITFTPDTPLGFLTVYTVTITTGIRDIFGNQLSSDFVWSFTTASGSDLVVSVSPLNGATDVPINTPVQATFNTDIDPSTVTTTTFTLANGGDVAGTVAYDNRVATFLANVDLAPNTTYTATLTTGIQTTEGVPLITTFTWSFTTGTNRIFFVAPPPEGNDANNGGFNDPLATIEEALSQALDGDIIELFAGTYPIASTIEIMKRVTIRGPQAGVDPRPSTGSARMAGSADEAIIDGNGIATIFRILVDGVIIDGLEIMDASGDMIESETSDPTNGTMIRFNILHDVGGPGDEAMQLRALTDGVVENNYIFDVAQDAINICCSSTTSIIRNNEIHDVNSANGAIYVYQSTMITIDSNLIYDLTNNDAIKVGLDNGGDAGVSSGHQVTNNIIRNVPQDGISVYTSNVLVDGNEVFSSSSTNGAIYVTYSVDDITLTNNNIHDNFTNGFKIGGAGIPGDNIVVNNNAIQGNNAGLEFNPSTNPNDLDAENNWWGDASGPSGSGPGTGDSVDAQVDFTPWLLTNP